MNYPNGLVPGKSMVVALLDQGAYGGQPDKAWVVDIDDRFSQPKYSFSNLGDPGGCNVTLLQDTPGHHVSAIAYIPDNGTAIPGDIIEIFLQHVAPWDNQLHSFRTTLDAKCVTLILRLTKSEPGDPIPVPSTSPQQYLHRYSVSAQPIGGTGPFTYVWSKSISGTGVISSDFVPSTPTGDSCTLEVTTTTQNFGGIAGSVTCTVTDSNSCTDTASADVADAPDPTSHCSSPSPDAGSGGDSCSCQRPPDTSGQPCPDGNLRTGPGDPNGYLNWPFGGGGGLTGGGSRGNPSPSRPTNPDPMFVL